MRITGYRISRLKCAKFKEYSKNKPAAEILKRKQFRVLEICKYNTIICFLRNRIKFVISLNGKTNQQRKTTALAVCSMLITFL